MNRKKVLAGLIAVSMALVFVAVSSTASAHPMNGQGHWHGHAHQMQLASGPAGGTGLTAKVIATSHETIQGATINASGYDIGIYVGPGVKDVRIIGDTVMNANDHGIFVQDTSHVMIKGSTVINNGLNRSAGIHEDKAIELVGTSHSIVMQNTVEHNMADGGIAVLNDGPTMDPGAPMPSAMHASDATHNIVMDNTVVNNAMGCGIVIASFVPGASVSHNIVLGNTVRGTGMAQFNNSSTPYVGGIVVAAVMPNTSVSHNMIIGNSINGSLIPGITLHSNAMGDSITGTVIIGNSISDNGPMNQTARAIPHPAGIMLFAQHLTGNSSASISMTMVLSNSVSNNYYGIYSSNATHTRISDLDTTNVTVPVWSA